MSLRSCVRCSSEFSPRTNQKYCKQCAPVVHREQVAACEARRRKRLGETLRERMRDRYANNPEVRRKARAQAKRHREQMLATPEGREILRERYRMNSARQRDLKLYGGNKYFVLARDDFACRRCGSEDNLHVHHLDGRGWSSPPEEKNNNPENLATLCASCHTKTHRESETLTRSTNMQIEASSQLASSV